MSSTDASASRRALEDLIAEAPPPLPDGFGAAVEHYVELLLEANGRLNLTRIVEPAAIARLHLLDALAALWFIDHWRPARAIDLGTGGGVPGLILAMARPAIGWTLVDSVAKKAAAVRGFADALGLANVEVLADRAEVVGRDSTRRAAHDLVTARAVATLPVLAEYALPLLSIGGRLLAWKGRIDDAELETGGAAAAGLGGGSPSVHAPGWAALGGRRLVVVEKESATPDTYPRRPGAPARRPLGIRP